MATFSSLREELVHMQEDLRVSAIILLLNQPTASCPAETVPSCHCRYDDETYQVLPCGCAFVLQPSFQQTLCFSRCDACINSFKGMITATQQPPALQHYVSIILLRVKLFYKSILNKIFPVLRWYIRKSWHMSNASCFCKYKFRLLWYSIPKEYHRKPTCFVGLAGGNFLFEWTKFLLS